MTTVTRLLAFLAFLAVLTSVATSARADPESDAKDLFTRGRELRAQGDCNGAADLFRRAVALYPGGLGSLRNLAECEEALGRWASARRAWIDLKRALIVNKDPKYAGWEDDAEKGEGRLAGKGAKLTIVVTVRGANGEGEAGAGVTVTVNGEPLAAALVGTELERDPGTYRLAASAPNATAPAEQAVTLATGDVKRVALALALRPAADAGAAGARSVREAPPPRPSSTSRTLGWTAVAVGGASLVAAVVSLVIRQSALSDLKSACPNYATAPCDPSVKSTDDRGKLASTLFTVFGAVGVVAVAGGVTLLLTAPSATSAPASAGVAARWSF
jgi:hypothetical protein